MGTTPRLWDAMWSCGSAAVSLAFGYWGVLMLRASSTSWVSKAYGSLLLGYAILGLLLLLAATFRRIAWPARVMAVAAPSTVACWIVGSFDLGILSPLEVGGIVLFSCMTGINWYSVRRATLRTRDPAPLSDQRERVPLRTDRVEWWLMDCLPDLTWARLIVHSTGEARVFVCDGMTHSFKTEKEARVFLLEDEFRPWTSFDADDFAREGLSIAEIHPPEARLPLSLLRERRQADDAW